MCKHLFYETLVDVERRRVDGHESRLIDHRRKRSILEGMGRLHAAGVTSFQEAASNTAILTALGELDAAGELKMDVQTHIVYKPEHASFPFPQKLSQF